jgi:hypothetical protein
MAMMTPGEGNSTFSDANPHSGDRASGRTRDRSGEPAPCFHELVLSPLIRLEGQGQSVRCHARSMPPRKPARAGQVAGGLPIVIIAGIMSD